MQVEKVRSEQATPAAERAPWSRPRIVNTTSGSDAESGIASGSEFLVNTS